MSPSNNWSQDQLHRYWQLQHRALKVDLRLTADGEGALHLRGTDGKSQTILDLDAAERALVAAGNARSSR